MAAKFFTNINLNKNQLVNAAIENNTSDPSSPAVGQIYFDTNSSSSTYKRLKVYAGSSTWVSIPYSGDIVNADISSSAGITVNKLLTNGTNAVTISSIGAPTGSVSFNSQAITSVSTISTSGDITVGGDLNVTGAINETSVNNLNVKDLTIVVAQGSANKTSSNNAGITVDLGTDGSANFYYTSSGDRFNFDKSVNLTSGNTYKINGTDVLSSTAVLGRTPGGNAAGDIVTTDGSQTLTYKTLTSPTISTILNTGTLTLPTTTGTIALTSDITGTVGHSLTFGTTGLTATSGSSPWNGSAAATIDIDTNKVPTISGSHTVTFTASANTSVTLPTSGTLITDSVTSLSSLATVGTITSGIWHGSTIDIGYGGTGATTAAAARTNLGVPGKYATTFTASAGTVVKTITQATHGLASSRNLIVQISDSSGNVVYTDVAIGATGTVTITFTDAAASYDTYDITIIG